MLGASKPPSSGEHSSNHMSYRQYCGWQSHEGPVATDSFTNAGETPQPPPVRRCSYGFFSDALAASTTTKANCACSQAPAPASSACVCLSLSLSQFVCLSLSLSLTLSPSLLLPSPYSSLPLSPCLYVAFSPRLPPQTRPL